MLRIKQEKLPVKRIRRLTKQLHRESRFELIGIEIIFKVLTSLVITPFVGSFILFSLTLSSEKFLTNTVLGIFHDPPFILAAVLGGFLIATWSFFEIVLVVNAIDQVKRGIAVTLRTLLPDAWKDLIRALKPKNWMMLLLAGFILPFISFFSTGTYLSNISIPQYIMDVVLDTPLYTVILGVFYGLFFYFVIRWILIFHFYVLEDEDFPDAAKHSWELVQNCILSVFFESVLPPIRATISSFIFMNLAGFLVFLLICFTGKESWIFSYSVLAGQVLKPCMYFMVDCLGMIAAYSATGTIYYELKSKGDWYIAPPAKRKIRSRLFIPACACVYGCFCLLVMIGTTLEPDLMVNSFLQNTTTVTAHRGYTKTAPENTLEAFQDAVALGFVDYIELDVQETKDGVIVVHHDNTLKRMTGDSRRIPDLTYEELQQLVIEGTDEYGNPKTYHIPTLEEVMKVCKHKISLNIETKTFPDTPDLEEKTARLIEENGYIKRCVVTSLDYSSLERMKAANPNIRTGYILSMGVGSYYDLEYCDFFSVESTFITSNMVEECHNRKKQVYAWTISTSDDAEKMLKAGVDSLITNDPVEISAAIADYNNVSTSLYDLWKDFMGFDKDNTQSEPLTAEDA